MKKRPTRKVAEADADDILPEYDFSKGRRNRYADRFQAGAIAVVLDPDVAERFPSAREVNDALRGLTKTPSKASRKPGSRRRTA